MLRLGQYVRSSREFVSIEEAADRTGVHRSTIWRLCKAGTLKTFRYGRIIRIYRDAFENWIASQTAGKLETEAIVVATPTEPVPLSSLDIPTRVQTRLAERGVTTAQQLAALTKGALCSIPGIGLVGAEACAQALAEAGLSLKKAA